MRGVFVIICGAAFAAFAAFVPAAGASIRLSSAEQADLYARFWQLDARAETRAEVAGRGDVLATLIEIDRWLFRPETVRDDLAALGDLEEEPEVLRAYVAALRCAHLVRMGQSEAGAELCSTSMAALQANAQWRREQTFLAARILYYDSYLLIRRGRMPQAIARTQEALGLAVELASLLLESQTRNSLAVALQFSGIAGPAVEEFERTLELAQQLGDGAARQAISRITTFNLGLAYLDHGQPAAARALFEEMVAWTSSDKQLVRELIARTNLVRACIDLGEPEPAVLELEEFLERADREVFDSDSHAHALLVLGQAKAARGDLAAALADYEQGLRIAASIPVRRHQLLGARGKVLLERGQLAAAQGDLERVIAETEDQETVPVRHEAMLLLGEVAARQGDWRLAYRYRRDGSDLYERNRLSESATRAEALLAKNEADRRQRDLQRALAQESTLRQQVELNNVRWFSVLVVLTSVGLLAYLARSRSHARSLGEQRRRQNEELEDQVQQRTLDLESEVAHRLRAEGERRELELQVAESDKLRALGQITGGVAHDFNNLLTVMMSAAEMLSLGPEDESERIELADSIVQAAESGRHITRDLLVYARRERLQPEVVRLDEHLLGLRHMLRRAAGEATEVVFETRSATAVVDPGHLTSAVINLVRNAADAGGASGSRVLVRVGVDEATEDPTAAGTAWVSVEDSGIGMSEEQIQRACEPFYSTKKTAMASGLGLSMVFGFVRQSGGEFEIDSELGVGTCVTMRFPESASEAVEPTQVEPGLVPPGLRVLLVDDSEAVRRVVGVLLRSLACEVVDVAGVPEAVEVFRSRRAEMPFDLLVTDVLLPGVRDGVDLARDLKGLDPDLPVLLISGFSNQSVEDFVLLGKPFDRRQLVGAVREALGLEVVPPSAVVDDRAGMAREVS